jgi:hypothetical protein
MEEPDHGVPKVVDAALGAAAIAVGMAVSVTRGVARAAAPVGRVVLHPPLIDKRLHPGRALDMLAERGRRARLKPDGELEQLVAAVVPAVVQEVLNTLDLNAIVRQRVDIDAIVLSVDIGAIIERVDIDAVVRSVDVNAIINRVDIDTIVRRLDLDAIADRIDIDRIVDRLDIDSIVAKVDIDAIIDRVDVVGLAEQVIEGIDLPELIRESTGSMSSEVVRDVRVQSMEADEKLAHIIDRMFRRRRPRDTDAPGEPESLAGGPIEGES